MKSVILIFLDGVGIGKADETVNPFFREEFNFTLKLFDSVPHLKNQFLRNDDGIYVFPADATFNAPGLPQSGTGQTAILCGIDAVKIVGKHFGPFPHSSLNEVLKEKNIYNELRKLGFSSVFANAYPPKFFDYLRKGHTRVAATTKAARFGNIALNTIENLNRGGALSHEIDNSRWIEKLRLPVKKITPETAAENLLSLAEKFNFVFYEFFYTDHWGHGRNLDFYSRGIKTLNQFLLRLIKNLNAGQTLIICSDHGNFEDLSVKTHTKNPAFMLSAGENANIASKKIKTIADIKSAVIEILSKHPQNKLFT